jgi:hypothetical protein
MMYKIFIVRSILGLRDFNVKQRSRSSGFLRGKSGVSNQHRRSARAAHSFNLGVELFCEGVDNAGAKPGFWLGKDAIRRASSVVGDRELSIRSRHIARRRVVHKAAKAAVARSSNSPIRFARQRREAASAASLA